MSVSEAPPFWWTRPGLPAALLWPASFVWGRVSARRMDQPPLGSVDVPVLCVGNFIAGGAGKTPAALALGKALAARGVRYGFLSRGYGGHLKGPALVEPRHRAADVGDEPLLLAAQAMTVVSADRLAGAEFLVAQGCEFIVMDDGFQNPKLRKDYSLAVVDGARGAGNGMVIPAGPLRAPLRDQLRHAHAVLVVGDAAKGETIIRLAARQARPVFVARTKNVNAKAFDGVRAIAFAGIADPSKLFASLAATGASVVDSRSYSDHHVYRLEEAVELLALAREHDAILVTTSKDMARLRDAGTALQELAAASKVLEIETEFEDRRATEMIIDTAYRNFENRRIEGR